MGDWLADWDGVFEQNWLAGKRYRCCKCYQAGVTGCTIIDLAAKLSAIDLKLIEFKAGGFLTEEKRSQGALTECYVSLLFSALRPVEMPCPVRVWQGRASPAIRRARSICLQSTCSHGENLHGVHRKRRQGHGVARSGLSLAESKRGDKSLGGACCTIIRSLHIYLSILLLELVIVRRSQLLLFQIILKSNV